MTATADTTTGRQGFRPPPWIPRWARLHPPRVRVTHHDVHHHAASTSVGLVFLYGLWLGWAAIVWSTLLFWWTLLVIGWFYYGLWLGVAWCWRTGVAAWADRRPETP